MDSKQDQERRFIKVKVGLNSFLIDEEDEHIVDSYYIKIQDIRRIKYVVLYERILGKIKYKGLIHREIMKCPDDKVVDHINHNGLDNRKSNLRITTDTLNKQRSNGLRSNNSSGMVGVRFCKTKKCWSAEIKSGNKRFRKYGFATAKEAVEYRDSLAKELFGDMALLNY